MRMLKLVIGLLSAFSIFTVFQNQAMGENAMPSTSAMPGVSTFAAIAQRLPSEVNDIQTIVYKITQKSDELITFIDQLKKETSQVTNMIGRPMYQMVSPEDRSKKEQIRRLKELEDITINLLARTERDPQEVLVKNVVDVFQKMKAYASFLEDSIEKEELKAQLRAVLTGEMAPEQAREFAEPEFAEPEFAEPEYEEEKAIEEFEEPLEKDDAELAAEEAALAAEEAEFVEPEFEAPEDEVENDIEETEFDDEEEFVDEEEEESPQKMMLELPEKLEEKLPMMTEPAMPTPAQPEPASPSSEPEAPKPFTVDLGAFQ